MHSHDDTPTKFDQPFWDNIYTERPIRWSGNANPVLVTEVTKLTPGTALDVGSGEGGDAFWLADQGWKTTGADISEVAIERAQKTQGDRDIAWIHRDLLDWAPSRHAYDLVTAHFFQLPPHQLGPAYTRFGDAVASGGHLLVVGHSPDDEQTAQHPHRDMLFEAEAVTSLFDGPLFDGSEWTTVVAETRSREGVDQEGAPAERKDTVVLLRRS